VLALQELQIEFGLTYLFISHSLPLVAQIASRIAVMRSGRIVELGTAEQVSRFSPTPYGKDVFSAVAEVAALR
jgi:ABC-type glutathione transport system ATPase component